MGKERGKYLTELRRSNAAGLHNQRPTRSAFKQAAIEEEMMDFVYDDLGEEYEPNDEDLELAEREYDELDLYDFWPEGDREVDFYDDYEFEELP